jgi:hypothetical protein
MTTEEILLLVFGIIIVILLYIILSIAPGDWRWYPPWSRPKRLPRPSFFAEHVEEPREVWTKDDDPWTQDHKLQQQADDYIERWV